MGKKRAAAQSASPMICARRDGRVALKDMAGAGARMGSRASQLQGRRAPQERKAHASPTRSTPTPARE